MSATPIPRTLTLTIFGDLDLSIINELPAGRKKILTKIVAPSHREKAYAFIRAEVQKGRQIFVICPRIEPPAIDTNSPETHSEITRGVERPYTRQSLSYLEAKSVKEEYEKLSKKVFPDLRVAMLHGKMKAKEKEEIMQRFRDGATDVLISTSVIEVGVDVPNATVMMIEGSERFGLAQLYQFKGRVGRGEHRSYCLLFTDTDSKTTHDRLKAIVTAKNGFELAEHDLKIRGPGEFFGTEQTGFSDLAMQSFQNPELIQKSRSAAVGIFKEDAQLTKYPSLTEKLAEFRREIHLE